MHNTPTSLTPTPEQTQSLATIEQLAHHYRGQDQRSDPIFSSEKQALQRYPWAKCSPASLNMIVLRQLDKIPRASNNGRIWQPVPLQNSCLNVNTFDRSTFQVHPETKGLGPYPALPSRLEPNHFCCIAALCLPSFREMKSWFAELDS